MSFKKIILWLSAFVVLTAGFYAVFSYTDLENRLTFNNGVNLANIIGNKAKEEHGVPTRLIIPAINVNAKVQYVSLAKDGSVGIPQGPSDVAWYTLGPTPGEKGSAIITGHYGPWITGAHSVFDNLGNLKVGDTVYVENTKGEKIGFKVIDKKKYGKNEKAEEVFNKNDGVYLNLITCNGEWLKDQKTYTDRLVIFTKKI